MLLYKSKKKGVTTMLKQYYVEYWNTKNQKVGMTISAQSALDAKYYAEKMPEFKCMVNYPTAI